MLKTYLLSLIKEIRDAASCKILNFKFSTRATS